MDTFSKRLKNWIETTFGSQKEFSKAAEINAVTLNGYVTGKRFPDEVFITKIAEMGCNIHWLFTGTGEKYSQNENGEYYKEMESIGLEEKVDNLQKEMDTIKRLLLNEADEDQNLKSKPLRVAAGRLKKK